MNKNTDYLIDILTVSFLIVCFAYAVKIMSVFMFGI